MVASPWVSINRQVGLRLEGDICKLISDVPGHSENFRGWGELRPYTATWPIKTWDISAKSQGF